MPINCPKLRPWPMPSEYPARQDWRDTWSTARDEARRRGYAGAEMMSGEARAFIDTTAGHGGARIAYRTGALSCASGYLTRAELLRSLATAAKARRTLASMAPDCMARARILQDGKRALYEARSCRAELTSPGLAFHTLP